jgi:hypothetical protein
MRVCLLAQLCCPILSLPYGILAPIWPIVAGSNRLDPVSTEGHTSYIELGEL